MFRSLLIASVVMGVTFSVFAQEGVMGDVMSGKLVDPSVGVWAWYDIKDAASAQHVFLRQAVVGEEKVNGKTGYWVETEVVPQIGYPVIYKMLLTGPASDPKNIHKVLVREATGETQEIPVDASTAPENKPAAAERKKLGTEKVDTAQGAFEAEHLVMEQEGKKTELWTSEKVPPMGIVKLVSPEGELVLQRYGKGGPDGQSALDRKVTLPDAKGETKVTVQVDGETREVPQEQTKGVVAPSQATQEGKPSAMAPSDKARQGAAAKKNFSTKKDGQ